MIDFKGIVSHVFLFLSGIPQLVCCESLVADIAVAFPVDNVVAIAD